MTTLMTHAAWILAATFALAIVYELYRATLQAGTSPHPLLHFKRIGSREHASS